MSIFFLFCTEISRETLLIILTILLLFLFSIEIKEANFIKTEGLPIPSADNTRSIC
jgi:hypothetical protein